jgi:hypothetical protein
MNRVRLASFYEEQIKMSHELSIEQYIADYSGYGGSDFVDLYLNVAASVLDGFVYSINVTVEDIGYPNAQVNLWPNLMKSENLSVIALKDFSTGHRVANLHLANINSSQAVSFWIPIDWVLRSTYNQTHVLKATSEVIFSNDAVYKRIIQSFQLQIGPDDNNTPESAVEIQKGNYTGLYLGHADAVDYYNVFAGYGQRIKIYINTWESLMSYLSVYDPEGMLVISSTEAKQQHTVDFVSNSTGYWLIKLQIYEFSFGYYYMEATE